MGNLIQEIIDFAIEREKEAAQFYTAFQKMSHFAAHADTLKEFAEMEIAHVEYLSNIKDLGFPEVSPDDVPFPISLGSLSDQSSG